MELQDGEKTTDHQDTVKITKHCLFKDLLLSAVKQGSFEINCW